MSARPAPQGFAKPLLVVVGVVVVFVLLVSTGALKLNFKVTRTPSSVPNTADSPPRNSDPSPTPVPKTKTYSSTTYAFSLEYPSDWIMKEGTGNSTVVGLVSRREDDNDKFSENTTITAVDLSSQPNATVASITDSWVNNSRADNTISNFELVERTPTTFAGVPAERLVFTADYQGLNNKGLAYITMKNQRAFVIDYTAEASSFDKYLPGAETINSSFKFN